MSPTSTAHGVKTRRHYIKSEFARCGRIRAWTSRPSRMRNAAIHDVRRTSIRYIRYRLEVIVISGLYAAICGREDFSDMKTFCREREWWLRGFLELPNGMSDADTFHRRFERLDPQTLGRCLCRLFDVASTRKPPLPPT